MIFSSLCASTFKANQDEYLRDDHLLTYARGCPGNASMHASTSIWPYRTPPLSSPRDHAHTMLVQMINLASDPLLDPEG